MYIFAESPLETPSLVAYATYVGTISDAPVPGTPSIKQYDVPPGTEDTAI
jgi:hypothetical protein